MTEFWEKAFSENQRMWGSTPTESALFARDRFVRAGVKDVLILGMGYGRNAEVFSAAGMNVTGIEISETAISLARAHGLTFPIHHGSVLDMPFDQAEYDGIFCFALIHLLDAAGRAKLIRDSVRQLRPGGQMIFTVVTKEAPMYGHGKELGEDWYERLPGLPMYFYDEDSVRREFGDAGLVECVHVVEATAGSIPFINAVCEKQNPSRIVRA